MADGSIDVEGNKAIIGTLMGPRNARKIDTEGVTFKEHTGISSDDIVRVLEKEGIPYETLWRKIQSAGYMWDSRFIVTPNDYFQKMSPLIGNGLGHSVDKHYYYAAHPTDDAITYSGKVTFHDGAMIERTALILGEPKAGLEDNL